MGYHSLGKFDHVCNTTVMHKLICNFSKEHGSFSPNEPAGPVSMRGTNIWGNSDEVAHEST